MFFYFFCFAVCFRASAAVPDDFLRERYYPADNNGTKFAAAIKTEADYHPADNNNGTQLPEVPPFNKTAIITVKEEPCDGGEDGIGTAKHHHFIAMGKQKIEWDDGQYHQQQLMNNTDDAFSGDFSKKQLLSPGLHTRGRSNEKKIEDPKTKMEIVKAYEKMKKENRHRYKGLHRVQFEHKIASKLGTTRNKINGWRKEMGRIRKIDDDETKTKIIKEIEKLKNDFKREHKYSYQNQVKIESELAKRLGKSRSQIYRWKKKLGLSKHFSTHKKLQLIDLYDVICREFSMKFNTKITVKIEEKIARKIGLAGNTIYKWKREFGIPIARKDKHTDEDRLGIAKQITLIRENDPAIKNDELAKMFGISTRTLGRWTLKFGI